MKLLRQKWKKSVYLSAAIALILMGMKEKPCAAQASGEDGYFSFYVTSATCSTKRILLKSSLKASASFMPTEAEIYRAKIELNGKKGKFRRIGSCKYFVHYLGYWDFAYEDDTVKSGIAYAYKFKAYCKTKEKPYQYKECTSKIIKRMAAETVGQYTCKIVKSTAKKLIVKLKGKCRENGLLESYHAFYDHYYYNAVLRYKNTDEDEKVKDLSLVKYSYDGKRWHKKEDFSIKGKQSVYLYFENRPTSFSEPTGIKITNYQYVQMFFWPVKYNYYIDVIDDAIPHLRFNLSSGTAAVRNFISKKNNEQVLMWDGDIFSEWVLG